MTMMIFGIRIRIGMPMNANDNDGAMLMKTVVMGMPITTPRK